MGKDKGKSKVSKFARGAAAATPDAPRGDEFDPGKWRVRFVDCSESDNGSFCVKFVGAGKHEDLGERIAWLSTSGKARHIAEKRAKALCMALAGFTSDEEYLSDFDASGEFINAVFPYDVDAAAAYLVEAGKAKSAKAALTLLNDAEFYVKISKGGEKDDGGFFRNVDGFLAADDGDDDTDEDDSDDEEPESEPAPRAKKKAAAKRKPAPRDEEEDEDDDSDDDSEDEDDSDDDEPESEPAARAKKKAKRK